MADFIAQLHYFNLFLVLTASLVAGIWGLILFFMKRTKTICVVLFVLRRSATADFRPALGMAA